jgi:hypothetical protein
MMNFYLDINKKIGDAVQRIPEYKVGQWNETAAVFSVSD